MVVLFLTAMALSAGSPKYNMSTPLNQWPFIEAHDSATGYLDEGGLIKRQLIRWTKTQVGNASIQLGCGARALDLRPEVENGVVNMHHGGVVVKTPMALVLRDIVEWAAKNPGPEDLAILYINKCAGTNCESLVKGLLKTAGIATGVTDCTALSGLTVASAQEMSKLRNGGHLLAVFGCVDENYDPAVSCSGTNEGKEYVCYNTSETKAFPISRMFDYLDKTSGAVPAPAGTLWQMQGIWQESSESVVVGELHDSSLVDDEVRSNLNRLLTAAVVKGRFPHINFMEVNNVCDGGLALREALLARVQVSQR